MNVSSQFGNIKLKRSRSVVRSRRIGQINHRISRGIDINKLKNGSKVIELSPNGTVEIDYKNEEHKAFAEDWLRD